MARRGDAPPIAVNPLGSLGDQIAAARRLKEGKVSGAMAGDMRAEQYRYLVSRAAAENGLPLPGIEPYDTPVPRIHLGTRGRGAKETAFNLRGVAEVLTVNGYDPAEEMVKILRGEPDPDDPEKRLYRVDPKTRLMFSNELLKYVHPQRKAVDVEQRVQWSGAELDSQLGAALGRLMSLGGGVADALIAEAVRTIEEDAAEASPPPGGAPFDPWSMV